MKTWGIVAIAAGAAIVATAATATATGQVHFGAAPVVASAAIHHASPKAVKASPAPKPKRHHRHHHAKVVYVPAASAASAPVHATPQLTNGVAVVSQFYQDLTNHDYWDAWQLGGDNIGGSDYNGWVAGYATTASIDITSYGTWNDGTVWADISATQTDGSIRTYSGTYTVANGVIVSANITQTS
jgi:hypothetical protein